MARKIKLVISAAVVIASLFGISTASSNAQNVPPEPLSVTVI